jgi:hypothetical protein
VGFAWVRGVLGQSVCSIIPWVIAMSWHPLKAEHDACCLCFCGGVKDRVNDPLSRFVPWVLGCLQG